MDRIRVLDVLRGIAILGILLANIESFGRAQIESMLDPGSVQLSDSEWLLEGLRTWFVTGKFRSLLAILFGVGLWMQYEKLSANGEWPNKYLKRTALLFAIGLVHILGIWFGDILTLYAVAALVASTLTFMSTRSMWITVFVLWGLGVGIGFLVELMSPGSQGMIGKFGEIGIWLTHERETLVFSQGSYGTQFLYRLGLALMAALNGVFALIHLIPLFLFGMILGREMFFVGGELTKEFVRKGLLVGFAGLILNGIPFLLIILGGKENYANVIELGVGSMLSVGILVVTKVLFDRFKNVIIWRPLEWVGKTALSCYLMQSLICTFIFYSFGLGWFGQLDKIEILKVVPIVWVINVIWAGVWLRFFTMGPIEYVWRSAVVGQWLRIRKIA